MATRSTGQRASLFGRSRLLELVVDGFEVERERT